MRPTIIRLAVAAATFLLACVTLAGHGQTSGTIHPWRVERNIKPVKESTLNVQPQIQEIFHHGESEPTENLPPPIPIVSTGENTLPVGGIGTFARGKIDQLFPGMTATGWVPPDPHGAVGPNHVVQIVNCSIAFFNKASGQKQFQQVINGTNGFFGSTGAGDFVFDPKAFYDPVSKRFFVLALEQKDDTNNKISKLCIGVSDDSDPNGTWFKYRIEAKLVVGSNQYWMDYPSYACNKDGVAVCGNMFALSGSSGWGGVQFVVMKKAPMLTGAATTATSLVDPDSGSGQVGLSSDASVDRIYGAAAFSNTSLRIYAITGLTGTPALSFTSAAIPSFTPISRNANSTNGRTFWTVDSRLFGLIYRGGKLYTSHHVSASSNDDRNMARWYEVATNNWPNSGSPSLVQAGSIPGGAGEDTFFPALNVNASGDLSVVYGRSSTSITADMMMASRKAGDPPGQLGTPVVLQHSLNANYGGQGANRWGDYFSVQIDPDGSKFWGFGMTGDANGAWRTHIESWQVSAPILTDYNATLVSVYTGTYAGGNLASTFLSDNDYFDVRTIASAQLGYVGALEATYTLDQPATNLKGLVVKVEAQAVDGATGMVWLKNWSTGQYEFVKSHPLTGTDSIQLFAASGDLTRFVSQSGQVMAVFRGHVPTRQSGGLTGFLLRTDQLLLQADWQNP